MHRRTDVCLLLIAGLYPCIGHDVTLSTPRRGFLLPLLQNPKLKRWTQKSKAVDSKKRSNKSYWRNQIISNKSSYLTFLTGGNNRKIKIFFKINYLNKFNDEIFSYYSF
jgi:hypothetical protein